MRQQGYGETGVEFRYYKPEEYKELIMEKKAELFQYKCDKNWNNKGRIRIITIYFDLLLYSYGRK